jgi:hypothetical protein
MTALLFDFGELCRCDPRSSADALETWRSAEAEAEAAAVTVRAACERYAARRCPETEAAYREADRAYDRARFRFQIVHNETVSGIRAIARFARELQLANDAGARLL